MFYFMFSFAAIGILVVYNIYVVGGLWNPIAGDKKGGMLAVVIKQWCSVMAVVIALIGAETSKESTFDWGKGDCPPGNLSNVSPLLTLEFHPYPNPDMTL